MINVISLYVTQVWLPKVIIRSMCASVFVLLPDLPWLCHLFVYFITQCLVMCLSCDQHVIVICRPLSVDHYANSISDDTGANSLECDLEDMPSSPDHSSHPSSEEKLPDSVVDNDRTKPNLATRRLFKDDTGTWVY